MSDTLIACAWCGVNLEVGASAWRVARQLFPGDSTPELLIHTLVIVLALLVALGTVLGALGLLYPVAYLALAGLAAVFLRLIPRFGDREDVADATHPGEKCAGRWSGSCGGLSSWDWC